MLDHKQLDCWNVDHLMAMWFGILAAEHLATTAAGAGKTGDDIQALLRGEEVTAGARMPVLAAALAATALSPLVVWGLETFAVTGWRLCGVSGTAPLLLLQLGDRSG